MRNAERKKELEGLCLKFRRELTGLLHQIGTGHPGGSLSCIEILTALYYEEMKVDPKRPDWEERDRLVLSKGHAAPALYCVLAEKGFFPKSELETLRQPGSRLQGHPCRHKTPGVELSTGPLGLGLGAGLGMALAGKLMEKSFRVYVILGDGELQEGAVWEAAQAAVKFRADHLTAVLDHNRVQLDGTVAEIMPEGNLKLRWEALGWNVITCDGHEINSICEALNEAKGCRDKPSIVIAETVKGKGISFMEGKNTWHGKVIGDKEYEMAMKELGGE